ncbi:MAG: Tat pathway signal protein [Pseudomonadales bacterium RIFCSPLOWO2_02_FULL_63_210]|nr:MAG: Tat pathway signal protein [Pseudomonadales bacterium RIFCSPLOWO2_02_FULL_63_210]
MNKTAFTLALAGAAALPALGQAREITLQTTLKEYRGNEAYLAIYVTDAQGNYQRTLWVSGKKAKYYKHLRDWAHAGNQPAEFDGLTGASVGSGETLEVSVELEDALIDAGYEIRIDSAVEDKRDNRAEIKVPLTQQATEISGGTQGYVDSFRYQF